MIVYTPDANDFLLRPWVTSDIVVWTPFTCNPVILVLGENPPKLPPFSRVQSESIEPYRVLGYFAANSTTKLSIPEHPLQESCYYNCGEDIGGEHNYLSLYAVFHIN